MPKKKKKQPKPGYNFPKTWSRAYSYKNELIQKRSILQKQLGLNPGHPNPSQISSLNNLFDQMKTLPDEIQTQVALQCPEFMTVKDTHVVLKSCIEELDALEKHLNKLYRKEAATSRKAAQTRTFNRIHKKFGKLLSKKAITIDDMKSVLPKHEQKDIDFYLKEKKNRNVETN